MGKMSGDKYPEDKRLVFDTITEQFDEWRERYSEELFEYIRTTCELKTGKKCLEIGPGTGQASDFAIQSGCDYTAIELGENLAEAMQEKYGSYKNFKMIHDDFETHSFAPDYFDLVYSAATIQWIKEDLAYRKCYEILKNKGYLAMFRMLDDYKSANADLYDDIQKVYDTCYEVDIPYTCKFNYKNGESYGFTYLGEYKFYGERSYTAQGFIEYIKTNADLITIKDSSRDAFFSGIRDAIMKHGNKIVVRATYVLDLYQKICDN